MPVTLPQAQKLAQSGQTRAADAAFTALLKAKPKNAVILQAAITFHNRYSRRYRAAVPLADRLVALKPNAATSHALAAETYCNCQRLPQALLHGEKAVQLGPNDPDALFAYAVALMAVDRTGEALDHLANAVSQDATHRPARLQQARALRNLGQLDKACAIAHALWAENPDDLNAITAYFGVTPVLADDPVLRHLEDKLAPRYATIGGPDYADVLKLIAKAQTDQGAHIAAFDTIAKAKATAPLSYDRKGYETFVKTLCANLTAKDFPASCDSTRPVLIVGMPRCGSTLVEQMLARHPDTASVGESPALNVIYQDTRARQHNGADMVAAIRQIPDDAAMRLAQRYLDETARDSALVIDKSLHNFELLGFFARLLPRAKIIHMRRNPMDTCISCYMSRLSGWHRYAQDLDSLGHAFRQYDALMSHWEKVLPNPIHTVHYEDVVQNAEATARQLLDFLDLSWTPDVLDQSKAGATSRTLSTWQVRQPLYQSAINRWERYGARVDPLRKALGPLAKV